MSAHAVLLAAYVAAAVVALGALYTAAANLLDPEKVLCNPPLLGKLAPYVYTVKEHVPVEQKRLWPRKTETVMELRNVPRTVEQFLAPDANAALTAALLLA